MKRTLSRACTKYSFMALFILLILFSCNKIDPVQPSEVKVNSDNASLTAIAANPPGTGNFPPSNDTVQKPTILDYQLPNPYVIGNMKLAYKNITGQTITPAVTELYVRFKPANIDQLYQLDSVLDARGLVMFDQPMDYHVVQQGDYYQDPSIPMEEITWMYAVVPPNFTFPSGIQYEQLAALHIPTSIAVEAEAERLAGLNADGDDYAGGIIPPDYSQASAGKEGDIVPNGGSCLPGYHWDDVLRRCVPDNCPEGYHWDEIQKKCMPNPIPPSPVAFPPRGRITVFDTQLTPGARPLRNVKIVAKRWFKVRTTTTDNNGNFDIARDFRNKVNIKVVMENQFASVRGIRGVRVWQMFYPVETSIGIYKNEEISSIDFTFNQTDDVNSSGNRIWAAATTMNAIQEHRDYASQFGFAAAPASLNVYLTNWGMTEGLASTPLFNRRFAANIPASFINTYLVANVAGSVAGGLGALFAVFARANIDMAIDYHIARDRFTSDWLKETVYHEMSHASHFSGAGNNWYTDFVNAELAEIIRHPSGPFNPYGDGTTDESPIIALGEGWTYHMGHFLIDQQYGLNTIDAFEQGFRYRNSDILQGGFVVASTGLNTHINLLEDFSPRRTNDPFHWIPTGLMHDLMDNRNDLSAFPIRVPLDDQVTGYSIGQLFNALNGDITTLQAYRERLLNQNGNNQAAGVNTIFSFYGY